MRMGSNSGLTGVILSVLFFPLMVSAQALPVPQSVPAQPPVQSANDPRFSRPVQAANDADFLKTSRASAATASAQQSGFGKVMSQIFSKRALAAGLRGTPQAMAVGLTLGAAMEYFSKDDNAPPDAVTNPGLSNRTWGEAGLNKGLLNASDLEVRQDDKKIELTTSGKTRNGRFYLTSSDGSSVMGRGSFASFAAQPEVPLFVLVPEQVEPFVFLPSPVYSVQNFSCASDIYTGSDFDVINSYKFTAGPGYSGNDPVALSACHFYKNQPLFMHHGYGKEHERELISFSVKGYDDQGISFSGYPQNPVVTIDYHYYENYLNPQSGIFEKRPADSREEIANIELSQGFQKRIAPRVLSDNRNLSGDPPSKQAEDIKEPLPLPVVNNMMNSVLMRVASQPDYQGIPFSTSSPVTVEEIQQAASDAAVPLTKGMLYQKINYSPDVKPSYSAQPVITENPDAFNQANNFPEPYARPVSQPVDMTHPGTAAPTLENPPDGKQILAPLLTLLPFIKNFSLPVRNAACPVAEFDVFEKHYVMNSHCGLLEKSRGLLALFAGIIWAFLSLRLILSA